VKLEPLVRHLRSKLLDFGTYVATDEEWIDDDADMLWKNEELVLYLQRAEEEFCRRYPIMDRTTAAVCQATVTLADPIVVLDPRVLQVDRIKLSTGTQFLKQIFLTELEEVIPDTWEAETGEPTHFIEDWERNKLRLYPIPITTGTADMHVGRNPLRALKWDFNNRSPEIPEVSHAHLLDWALYLAYLKDDTEETADVKRAMTFRDLFNDNVGGDISVKAMEARRHHAARPPRTRAYDR